MKFDGALAIRRWLRLCLGSLLILSLASALPACKKIRREDIGKTSELKQLAAQARAAVARQTSLDLSDVGWEVADEYRLTRLIYSGNYDYFRVILNNRALARQIAEAEAAAEAVTTLGLFKRNIPKVFININAISFNDIQQQVRRYARKYCDSEQQGCARRVTSSAVSEGEQEAFRRSVIVAVLIHEFAHAALDRLLPEMATREYQPGFSGLMMILQEGYAEYLTQRICRQLGCESGYAYLADYNVDLQHIHRAKKRRLYKLEMELRQFTYNQGKQFVEQIAGQNNVIESLRAYVLQKPSSMMAVVHPENRQIKLYGQSQTERMLRAESVIEQFYPPANWAVLIDEPRPPLASYILSGIFRLGKRLDAEQLAYHQMMIFEINRIDLFDRFSGHTKEGNQYVILRDFGSSKLSQSSFQKESAILEHAYQRVGSQQRGDDFQSLNLQAKNDSITLARFGRYSLLALTAREKYSLPERVNRMVDETARLISR